MVCSYECDKCGAMFTVQATVAEKEKGLDLRCPSCGEREVTQNLRGVGMAFGKGGPLGPCCGPGAGCS